MIELPPDSSFYIHVVCFVVFWQLLKVLLFTPAQGVLKERAKRTTGSLQTAEALRTEAATLRTDLEGQLQAARTEGQRRADEIRRAAEAADQALLARHHEEATALLTRARAETERQVEAVRAPLRAEAERLAEAVVQKVLGRAA